MKIATRLLLEFLQVLCLPHHFVALKQQHLGIIPCDESRCEKDFFLIGLAVEDVEGQLQQLVTTGGIDIGGIEQRVAHLLYAAVLSWQAVDACEERQTGLPVNEGFAGADGRTVVMPEHQVDGI